MLVLWLASIEVELNKVVFPTDTDVIGKPVACPVVANGLGLE